MNGERVDEVPASAAGRESLRRMQGAPRYNAWLLDRSRPYLGRRVLDVGAGVGTFTEMLARDRDLVVAVEPDREAAELLRARFSGRANIFVVEGDVASLDGASVGDAFDSAVCFNVLEHIPDDAAALREIREWLAPGGRILLIVPAHPALYGSIDRTVAHERRYAREGLRRLLADAGFEVEELRHVNPVGALGWFVSARVLRREHIPERPLRFYDRFVPVLRRLDRLRLPFGLSLWAVARRFS